MSQIKYSPELIEQVLKDLESTKDVSLICQKHKIPAHAVYRFRRDKLKAPEISKDKKIRELSKELADKDLEVKILRELLKKTYQVMPID
jgi:predicted RNase H-like nuclease (RuvC/YqgF family)